MGVGDGGVWGGAGIFPDHKQAKGTGLVNILSAVICNMYHCVAN